MFGLSSLPVVGGAFDDSEEKAQEQYAKALALYNKLELPSDAYVDYSPESLQYGADFNPLAAEYQTVTEDPRLLSDQASHLNILKDMAARGLSDVDAAGFDKARSESAQMARGQNEAVMSNLAARGMAGGGQELLSRELAGQKAAERARASMQEQAATAAKQRALYEQAYGSEMGSQRDDNARTATNNADIINRFNQLNTGAKNTAAYNNLTNRQNIGNQNIANRNQAQLQNQTGARNYAQQQFGNRLNKVKGQSGALSDQAKAYMAEAEGNRATRAGIGAAAGGFAGGDDWAKYGGMLGGL